MNTPSRAIRFAVLLGALLAACGPAARAQYRGYGFIGYARGVDMTATNVDVAFAIVAGVTIYGAPAVYVSCPASNGAPTGGIYASPGRAGTALVGGATSFASAGLPALKIVGALSNVTLTQTTWYINLNVAGTGTCDFFLGANDFS
jgi:hypothetical protein